MSRFSEILNTNKFVVTTELTPPKGVDLSGLFAKAEALRSLVDAFNLTESHAARMAMEPTAVAHLLLDRGLEPIVQMTSRDKNRIAIQACLLGAAALGVQNVVFMGGDPPENGDHPEARAVFDLFASQLLEAATALQNGRDLAGNRLNAAPEYCAGAVVNPGAADLALEIENMGRKLDAGAKFFQTQAIYDPADFEAFVARVDSRGFNDVPLLAGVIPVKSVKMANYMNHKVPGVNIPEDLIREISAAEQSDRVAETSVAMAARLIREIRPMCRGLHLMAIGWESKIPAILGQSDL